MYKLFVFFMIIISLSLYSNEIYSANEKDRYGAQYTLSNHSDANDNINSNRLFSTSAGEDMIIITDNTLKSYFEIFAKEKNKEGVNTTVVTTGTTGTTANDIRSYLFTAKSNNSNLKYVLLGGDATIIPPKMIFVVDEYGYDWYPTDFYYSNVLQPWTNNLDQLNFTPDLYVGRIPANTLAEVDNFIGKYKNYRHNTDYDYTNESLLFGNNINNIPNSRYGDLFPTLISNHIDGGKTIKKIQDMTSGYPAFHVENWIESGLYSFIYTATHGGPPSDFSCSDLNATHLSQASATDRQLITIDLNSATNGRDNLTPQHFKYLPNILSSTSENKPYFMWLSACHLSRFAGYSNGNTSDIECIGAEFINNSGGAVAFYSSSWLDSPDLSYATTAAMFDLMNENNKHKLGYVTFHGWDWSSPYRANSLKLSRMVVFHTLFGDPSMDVWSGQSKHFSVEKKVDKLGTVFFYVSNIAGLNNDDIVWAILDSDDEIVTRGCLNFFGTASYTGKFGKDWKFTLCTPNYIPFCEEITGIANRSTTLKGSIQTDCNPNPFNPITNICFDLPESGLVKLNIYNIKGQLVKTLINEELEAGSHSIVWNGKNSGNAEVSSGIYFYRIEADGEKPITRKMILMK